MSSGNSSGTLTNNSGCHNINYIPSSSHENQVPFIPSVHQFHSNLSLDSYNDVSLRNTNHLNQPNPENHVSPNGESHNLYSLNLPHQRIHSQNFNSYLPPSESSNYEGSQTVPESSPEMPILNQPQNNLRNPRVNPILNSIQTIPKTTEVIMDSSIESSAGEGDRSNRNAVELNRENLSNFYKTVSKTENDLISSRLSVAQIPEHYSKLEISNIIKPPNLKSKYSSFALQGFVEVKDVDQPVETISNGWIKLDIMKKIAPYNKDFIACIDSLSSEFHIAGWKKSRGDGNCYYRAVITRYLEIIVNPYSATSNLKIFILMIEKLQEFLRDRHEINGDYHHALGYILAGCKNLEDMKNQPNENFMLLMYWFQLNEFDISLVRVARLLTYQALIQKSSEYRDFGINIESISSLILTMGEEAEAFVLMLLPLQLCIKVVQYNLFKKVNMEIFPNQDDKVIEVHIVRRGGHYDILYTKQELERDMYRFSIGTYYFYNQ